LRALAARRGGCCQARDAFAPARPRLPAVCAYMAAAWWEGRVSIKTCIRRAGAPPRKEERPEAALPAGGLGKVAWGCA
jgi:hypothetical protein